MRNKIVMIKHETAPFNDRAGDELAKRGYIIDWRTPFTGEPIFGAPNKVAGDKNTGDTISIDEVAGTLIYGGPYCISDIDKLAFMKDEIHWIETCMAQNLPVLGFCQGAQMIAHILGASVGPGTNKNYEFGYYPVYPTTAGADFIPHGLHVTQAHFHTFDIPQGAVHLARSDRYENQAFSYGKNIFGFQFHAEITRAGFTRWQNEHWGDTFFGKPGAQTRDEQNRLAALHDADQDAWFRGFIADLFPPIG